jgi:hypothetical protein
VKLCLLKMQIVRVGCSINLLLKGKIIIPNELPKGWVEGFI